IVGYVADVSSSALNNATALGNGAVVNASNKIQLGNTSVTLVNTSGAFTATGAITSSAVVTGTTITGTSIVKSGGTSAQFLKADGSVDASTYLTSAITTLDGLTDSKSGGASFSNSILIGHQTTGVLNNADRNIGIGIGALSSI